MQETDDRILPIPNGRANNNCTIIPPLRDKKDKYSKSRVVRKQISERNKKP
jgi:hypothetical protein